jgi:nitronate monooxygenase
MTAFLDLALEVPVIQAPMAGVSTPELAAAVGAAGGLGSLGLGASTVEDARAALRAAAALTTRPLNANLFLHAEPDPNPTLDSAWIARLAPLFAQWDLPAPKALSRPYRGLGAHPELFETILREGPRVVSVHFGLPGEEQVRALKATGRVLLATATNEAEALQAQHAGMDAVIAQGWEAGGHRGVLDPTASDERLPCLILTRRLVPLLNIPVIAAGGLMDGRDIRAALDAGAVAAQMGTAFIGCPESAANPAYRQALREARAGETLMTAALSGRPARSLRTTLTDLLADADPTDIPAYPLPYSATKALVAEAERRGLTGFGIRWAGTGAHRSRAMPAARLLATLARELAEATQESKASR